jgi:hypothetical protein
VTYGGRDFPSIGAFARHLRGYANGRLTSRQRNRALDKLREATKEGE